MKRSSFIFLSVLCVLALCIGAVFVIAATEERVYVSSSGNDSNSGESAASPKATLAAAIKALGGVDGTIVVCGDLTLNAGDGAMPSHSGKVTLTSDGYNAKVTVKDNITFGGETKICDISLYYPAEKLIFCAGNSAVFGDGIEVSYDATAPSIYGGKNSAASGASADSLSLSGSTLQVDSGTWNKVYCGNYRKAATNPTGTLTGNTTLTISGGSFLGGVSATGQENKTGNSTLKITGGEFLCSVYGIAEPCYDLGYQLSVVGNINMTITGGMFAGDIAVALRDYEAAFEGRCNINLTNGDFSRLNSVCGAENTLLYANGKCTSYLNFGTNVDINSEYSGDIDFTSSLSDGISQPSITYIDGWYYYTYSSSYNKRTALWIKRAANLADIEKARPTLVWANALTPTNITGLSSPQLVYLDGEYYIYTTCSYTSGEVKPNKPVVFTPKISGDPMGGFNYYGPLDGLDSEVFSYMSPTYTEWEGKLYMISSGFFREGDRVVGSKHYQSIFISEMASPTELKGKAVKIAEATESFEISNAGKCKILEKPQIYKDADDGKMYVLYSASEAGRDDYCTGLLRFDGTKADSLMSASLWYKYSEPIHTKDASVGIYSPGSAMLLPSPDGGDTWLVYNAKLTSGTYTTSGRVTFVQPFSVDEQGIPTASKPLAKNTALSTDINSMPLYYRMRGFTNRTVYVSGSGSNANNGLTAASPKATLTAAINALGGRDGRVVICGDITVAGGTGTLPAYAGKITFSSNDIKQSYSARITLEDDLYFGGKTVLEHVSLYTPTEKRIFCEGHDSVIGEGIEVSYDTVAPSVYGGKNATLTSHTAGTLALSTFSLQVDSGTWNKVYCGNYRALATEKLGRLTGDSFLTINGGRFLGGVSATGQENRTGNIYLNVNGGEFLCSVYGVAEPCNDFDKRLTVTGDICMSFEGGLFLGDISLTNRETDTLFTGHCDIKLLSGDFSRVNLIEGAENTMLYARGKCTSYLQVGPKVDIDASQVGDIEFTNTIADFPDPSVYYYGGWYYYSYSKVYKGKPALWMRRAANFSDISYARPQLVWAEADTPSGMVSLWAPQLVFLEGRFYLYATCSFDKSTDDTSARRKPMVFVSKTADDPMDGFTYYGPMDNIDDDVYSFLSPRFINWQGKTYMINGGFFRAEDRIVGEKHIQSLFITEMSSPTSFTGRSVQIATATYSWEISNKDTVEILEGPFAYTGASDGKLYILYSANETATDNYCTGLLRFDGKSTDSITNASLWYKYSEPIQKKDPSLGIYSPGAAVLTTSPDGSDVWMIYHAKLSGGIYTYDGRVLFAQPFKTDSNGVPADNSLLSLDTVLSYTKNSMPLCERVLGIDRIVDLSEPPEAGDVDCDRRITNKDITLVIRYLSGFNSDIENMSLCDVNGDGKVNNRDAIGIIKKIA